MIITDNIHGYIKLSDLAESIINTYTFQQLKRIKQLGGSCHVYPSCVHTRFEHSIGTYYLANRMITSIKNNQPELKITDEIVELVSIAGLCHDLGHGAFSHLYDEFLQDININVCHEERSIKKLKYIIKNDNIKINNEQLKVISDLIYPEKGNYFKWALKYKIGQFLLMIISNKENSLDVDKLDYIKRDCKMSGLGHKIDYDRLINEARVIDDIICYPKQVFTNIYDVFNVRYLLYKKLYCHKTVLAIELMIKDFLKLVNENMWLDIDNIYDDILYTNLSEHTDDSKKDLYKRICNRDLYKCIYEKKITNEEYDSDYKNEEILCLTRNKNVEMMKIKIGFVNGKKKNPIENIYLYDHRNMNKKFKGDIKQILMVPETYQECYVYVFDKN